MPGTYGARAVDYPDSFKNPLLSRWEPYPLLTGSQTGSGNPTLWFFHPVTIPDPLIVSNVYLPKSFNVGVPAATSQNSSGTYNYSHGHSMVLFQRQDYGANSTNFSYVTSASGGLTAQLTFSSGSQSFAMSWITDSTGGAGTFSTTSGAGNWSNFVTGNKMLPIPFVTVLTQGEYFIAHRNASTTAQTGSNVTILSVSGYQIVPQSVTLGGLGASTGSIASSAHLGMGLGVANAITTNATMAGSAVSASVQWLWVQNFFAA